MLMDVMLVFAAWLGAWESPMLLQFRSWRMGNTHHNTAIKYASNNGCSSTGRLWERHSSSMEGRIAVVVGEVEARHGSQRILRAKAAISVYSGGRDRVLQVVRMVNMGYR